MTEPAWLVAWREKQGCQPEPLPQAPAVPHEQAPPRARQRAGRPSRRMGNSLGFREPDGWPYDGGLRREPVLDIDFDPPRVVRRVGWQKCMACGTPFFSEDVLALRLCDGPDGCRNRDDE